MVENATQPEKECKGCGHVKSLAEFSPSRQSRDGRVGKCHVCRAEAQRKRRIRLLMEFEDRYKGREISQENKNFFRLGLMKGDDLRRDIQKAIGIMEKANRALLEVIQEADARDQNALRVDRKVG